MNEAVEFRGSFGQRLQKLLAMYPDSIGIKRLYVQKNGKINLTLLFNGTQSDIEKLKIFLNSQMPTEENCTIFIHYEKLNDDTVDYNWKIELIDIMVGK